MEKHSVSRLSYLFAHLYLLSSDSFSSHLLSSNLPLLSASPLLCFSSVHIVGSLTSKLPSINTFVYTFVYRIHLRFISSDMTEGFDREYGGWKLRGIRLGAMALPFLHLVFHKSEGRTCISN